MPRPQAKRGGGGGLRQHSLPHARDFGITLLARIDRAMSPLRSAELFAPPPWDRLGGMEPCPASSSGHVINTEHINQLSCLHAQSFKFLTCVRFDQALCFFGKKVAYKKFACPNFVCDAQIQIPRLLGGSFDGAFPLAYDYTCTASFLVRVLRHNMHHIDLSDLQAGSLGSCAYPYVPDCSARE